MWIQLVDIPVNGSSVNSNSWDKYLVVALAYLWNWDSSIKLKFKGISFNFCATRMILTWDLIEFWQVRILVTYRNGGKAIRWTYRK